MTQDTHTETDPAQAFEGIGREIRLLRHAIEGLTAARETVPDYSETLGRMGLALAAIGTRLKQIEDSPTICLTPQTMAQQISQAAQDARAEERKALLEARDALSRALGQVDGMAHRGRAAGQQRERLLWTSGGAFLAGILIWSFLPGAIARALPESWHVPEWMAARTMGMEQEAAGRRMVSVACEAHRRIRSASECYGARRWLAIPKINDEEINLMLSESNLFPAIPDASTMGQIRPRRGVPIRLQHARPGQRGPDDLAMYRLRNRAGTDRDPEG